MNTVATKQTMQIKQLIFHNLMQIVEMFPQYTVAQHLYFILRRKDENSPELYFWDDIKVLKKFEDYKDELETELANTVPEIDD